MSPGTPFYVVCAMCWCHSSVKLGMVVRKMEYLGLFGAKPSDFQHKPNNDVFTFGVWKNQEITLQMPRV